MAHLAKDMTRRKTDLLSTPTDSPADTGNASTAERRGHSSRSARFGIPIRGPEDIPGLAPAPDDVSASASVGAPADRPVNSVDHPTTEPAGPTPEDAKKVELGAVRLLARREHSSQELRRKLRARGHDDKQVDDVLAKLEANRLQSDERFTGSFVTHHARRGQGPVRIRAELRQQGISEAQIEQHLATAEQDWARLAAEVRQRKFGAGLPSTASERAKQARFLQYRGFNSDQIRAALDFDPDEDVEP